MACIGSMHQTSRVACVQPAVNGKLGTAVRRVVVRYAGQLTHAQPAVIASFAGGTRASGDQICVSARACLCVAPALARPLERPAGSKFGLEIRGLTTLSTYDKIKPREIAS